MSDSLTPAEAAEIIGCSVQQVRALIRAGKLSAEKIYNKYNQHGYVYELALADVLKIRDSPSVKGCPRGYKRVKG